MIHPSHILIIILHFGPFYCQESNLNFKCNNMFTAIICIYSNFYKFEKLVYNSSQDVNYLLIKPAVKLEMDTNFEILNLVFSSTNSDVCSIVLMNIKAFHIYSVPFWAKDTKYNCKLEVIFDLSDFIFLKNNKIIEKCEPYTNDSRVYSFFPESIFSASFLPFVEFPNEICLIIFKDLKLEFIKFSYLFDSLIKKKIPIFQNNKDNNFEVNSTILNLEISLSYQIRVESKTLNTDIFKKLESLVIFESSADYMENNLFKNFKNIKYIGLGLKNLKSFIHKGLNWIQDLDCSISNNYSIKILFKQEISYYFDFYEFDDEDFCLLKQYPVDKNILPLFSANDYIKCTCSLIYMLQNFGFGENEINNRRMIQKYENEWKQNIKIYNFQTSLFYLNQSIIYSCLKSYQTQYSDCNFTLKINKCKVENLEIKDQKYFFLWNFVIDLKTIEFFLSIVLAPIVGFIGVFLNLITIIILIKHQQAMKESYYKYMVYNAFFNLFSCLVYSTKLMNDCIFYQGVYCSSVRETDFAQYFMIYIRKFCGNILRLCSNYTHLLFTLERYIIITKTKNYYLTKFSKTSPKRIIFKLFPICLILSIVKIFEYSVNTPIEFYPFRNFPTYNLFNHISEKNPGISDKIKRYSFVSGLFLNTFFNNIFPILIITFIDINLLKFVKKYFDSKSKIKSKVLNKEDNKKSIRPIILMILFNLIAFSLFRLPDSIFSTYFNISVIFALQFENTVASKEKNWINNCHFDPQIENICDPLENISDFLYFLSYSFFVIFYLLFNKIFKDNFKNFVKNKFEILIRKIISLFSKIFYFFIDIYNK